MVSLLLILKRFTDCSGVSNVDFEQVNAGSDVFLAFWYIDSVRITHKNQTNKKLASWNLSKAQSKDTETSSSKFFTNAIIEAPRGC